MRYSVRILLVRVHWLSALYLLVRLPMLWDAMPIVRDSKPSATCYLAKLRIIGQRWKKGRIGMHKRRIDLSIEGGGGIDDRCRQAGHRHAPTKPINHSDSPKRAQSPRAIQHIVIRSARSLYLLDQGLLALLLHLRVDAFVNLLMKAKNIERSSMNRIPNRRDLTNSNQNKPCYSAIVTRDERLQTNTPTHARTANG